MYVLWWIAPTLSAIFPVKLKKLQHRSIPYMDSVRYAESKLKKKKINTGLALKMHHNDADWHDVQMKAGFWHPEFINLIISGISK